MTALEGSTPEIVSRFEAVLRRKEVRQELERVLRSRWPAQPTDGIEFHVLKAHRDRCTFEAASGTPEAERSVITKVYATDRLDVFAAMESLVAAGFGSTSEFAVAPALAYVPSHHVMIEEKVYGPSAMEVFMADDLEKQRSVAQRCGRWLGRFHSGAPNQGRLAEPKELLVGIRYWAHKITGGGESLASKAALLLQKLEAALPAALAPFEPRAGHGSFMPEHVLLNGSRTVTIDFDEFDVADPARDLAWFVVSLQRLGLKKRGSLRVHDQNVEAFLRAYVESGPPKALSHLSFYRAAECLHRAHRDLLKRVPPIPDWSEMMLDEGIRALGWVRVARDQTRREAAESPLTRSIRGLSQPRTGL